MTLFLLKALTPGNGIGNEDLAFSFFPGCSASDAGADELPILSSVCVLAAGVGLLVRMLTGRTTEFRDTEDSGRLWPKSDMDGDPGAVEPLVLAVEERAGLGRRS